MTKQNIHLRPATIDDLPLLLKWDEEPHVIESDPNDDWQWETELLRSPEWREQLVAEINGIPIGFVQIIDPALEEDHYWGDAPNHLRAIDIWLGNAEDLGKGYGTEIMKQAINKCFSNPNVTAILIDPIVLLMSSVRLRTLSTELVTVSIRRPIRTLSDVMVSSTVIS